MLLAWCQSEIVQEFRKNLGREAPALASQLDLRRMRELISRVDPGVFKATDNTLSPVAPMNVILYHWSHQLSSVD